MGKMQSDDSRKAAIMKRWRELVFGGKEVGN